MQKGLSVNENQAQYVSLAITVGINPALPWQAQKGRETGEQLPFHTEVWIYSYRAAWGQVAFPPANPNIPAGCRIWPLHFATVKHLS